MAGTHGEGKSLRLRGNGRSLHFCITRTNEPTRREASRPQMEIPDLYANSIFVAARGVGRRVAQRRPCSKEAMADFAKVQVFSAGYPYGRNAISLCTDLFWWMIISLYYEAKNTFWKKFSIYILIVWNTVFIFRVILKAIIIFIYYFIYYFVKIYKLKFVI